MNQYKFKLLLVVVVLMWNAKALYAQLEANNWYFGNYAGVSFSSGEPIALLDGALSTREGCATISDTNGNLLFYTDGQTVWNKNHLLMQNGGGLLGHPSSTQSAIIVPKPGSNTIYYIFTVPQALNYDGLRYSVVDMTLAGGLGAVTNQKNILLIQPVVEKVTAVRHANNIDIWVITHGRDNNTFYSFLITSAGVNMIPVITNIGTIHGPETSNYVGYMKSSPDGNYLAYAIQYPLGIFELFSFNKTTGVPSNPITFTNYLQAYGLEFSPDSQKLYLGRLKQPPEIYQVDLIAGSSTAIINSATLVGISSYETGALQLGPDGKIYITFDYCNYLGVINNPNNLGTACNFVHNGVFLSDRVGRLGLPTFIQSYFIPVGGYSNSPICVGNTLYLHASAPGAISYAWTGPAGFTSTLQNPVILNVNLTNMGIYTVTALFQNGSTSSADIPVIINPNPVISLGPDTSICQGTNLILTPGFGFKSYLWSNGNTQWFITITDSGKYWVYVTDFNNCIGYAEKNVVVSPKPPSRLIYH
jgi:hypothetical protein